MASAQGQGVGTKRKEDGFGALFTMSLRISTAPKVAQFPYWHIDLNAGSGVNEKAGCDGSPLVFLRAALEVGRPVRAIFCEIDSDLAGQLAGRLQGFLSLPEGSTLRVIVEDNAAALETVAQTIRQTERSPGYAMGTCLCDPNGWKGFPVEALEKFLIGFPRIDCIINVNVSLIARVRGCKASDREAIRNGFVDWPEIRDVLPRFGRKHWWIRNPPLIKNGERFIIVAGTNAQTKRKPFKDFFPLESEEGQMILTELKRAPDGLAYLWEEWHQ